MKYTSKGLTISKSMSHKDMWIIENEQGKFWNLYTDYSTIIKLHPPDND